MNPTAKYEYSPAQRRHTWSVVGELMALHFWVRDFGVDEIGCQYSGGLEVHYKSAPPYMKDDEPSNEHCWLLEGPCWHDGSSLVAEEKWIPMWLSDPEDQDGILARLSRELDEREREAKETAC